MIFKTNNKINNCIVNKKSSIKLNVIKKMYYCSIKSLIIKKNI